MKTRSSNVIDKANALKVKCWKILAEMALEERDPTACALIISIAENSRMKQEGL